jgi:transcriptional regulator with XRE-family HTH domain
VRSGPIDDLVAYRPALGRHLSELRSRRGYSREEAAKSLGLSAETLRLYEIATWRPSLTRMMRLAALYEVSLIDILQDVAECVRPRNDTPLPLAVTALLLFGGVTPEQVAQGDSVPSCDEDSVAEEPLGDALKYRRDDDPLRVRGGLLLRREYEAGASIRTLLVEANTRLRGPGAHVGGA